MAKITIPERLVEIGARALEEHDAKEPEGLTALERIAWGENEAAKAVLAAILPELAKMMIWPTEQHELHSADGGNTVYDKLSSEVCFHRAMLRAFFKEMGVDLD